jgi:hypothetical protein
MAKPNRRKLGSVLGVYATTIVVYVAAYIVLTRVISPEVPTPFGPEILLGVSKSAVGSPMPRSDAEVRKAAQRSAVLHTLFAPLIWLDRTLTGAHVAKIDTVWAY